MSPGRLGFLAGLAVLVIALAIGVATDSDVWMAIVGWWVLFALIGWVVFAIRDRRRGTG